MWLHLLKHNIYKTGLHRNKKAIDNMVLNFISCDMWLFLIHLVQSLQKVFTMNTFSLVVINTQVSEPKFTSDFIIFLAVDRIL